MAIFNFPIRQKDHAAQAVRQRVRCNTAGVNGAPTSWQSSSSTTITFASALVSAAAMLTLVNLASHIVT